MSLPSPNVIGAQAVLGFKEPSFDAGRDERFATAAASAFPHVVTRTVPTPASLPNVPSLVLASTSSQLAVSPAQADFQVRFYGDYLTDISGSFEYIRGKLRTALDACEAARIGVVLIGVVVTLHIRLDDADRPSPLIKHVHLTTDLPDDVVNDALVRVALRIREIYFLNVTASTYESRSLQQPVFPGVGVIRLRPWDGVVTERGLELTLDMNNVLEAQLGSADPTVTPIALNAIIDTERDFAADQASGYLETGNISIDAVIAAGQAATA